MSELSKQALQVENTQSFPNNNTGYITPSKLREFNVDMIDSLVDEQTYNVDSASWNNSIDALETFTASQQPSFTALNAFTASQLGINSGVNSFTQSADGRLDTLEGEVANIEAFTASINEIRDNGTLQGYSTRFFFEGLVSASITPNVNGAIATINVEQDGTKLNTASFNAYTNSVDTSINDLDASASLALTTASFDNGTRNLTFTKGDNQTFSVNIPDVSGSAGNFVTTASFNAYTQSNDSRVSSLEVNTASVDTSITNINSFTASATQRLDSIESVSGSWITESETGSFATTGSNSFIGIEDITGSLNVSGSSSISGTMVLNADISLPQANPGRPVSAIKLFQGNTVAGTAGSKIQFWSGSYESPQGTYVNLQVNPSNGALAISGWPANNHFLDFDPFQTASLFTAPIGGLSGPLLIKSNTTMSGSNSLTFRVSSSLAGGGLSSITPIGFSAVSGSLNTNVTRVGFSHSDATGAPTFVRVIGFAANPLKAAAALVTTAPSIYAASSTGAPEAVISFQYKGDYTDGTVTMLKPAQFISGSTITGSLNVSGSTSMTGSLTIQSGSGDLFMYGHKMFNLGVFTSTLSQSGSANVSQSMTFNNTEETQGVTLNGGGTQLTITNGGYYNIQFSAQILADAGADDVRIWLKKNGTNIANTTGRVTLANNDELMASWNYVVSGNAGDYYELVWESSAGDALLLFNPAAGNYPAVPSVIATVTQVR